MQNKCFFLPQIKMIFIGLYLKHLEGEICQELLALILKPDKSENIPILHREL